MNPIKILTGALFVCLFAPRLQAADWPMDRYNAARSADGSAPSIALPLNHAFSVTVGDNSIRNANYSSPIVYTFAGQTSVYVGSVSGKLYAFDKTGVKKWEHRTRGSLFAAGAVAEVAGTPIICFGSTDGKVYALNALTGAFLWSKAMGAAVVASPVIDTTSGIVFVNANNGKIAALNIQNGNVLWEANNGNGYQWAGAVVGSGNVYVAGIDGGLTSYAVSNGAENWHIKVAASIRNTPAYLDSRLYVPGSNGKLICIDAANGSIAWTLDSSEGYLTSPAVTLRGSEKLIVFATQSGKVQQYKDLGTSVALVWSQTTGGTYYASPSVVGDLCFIPGNNGASAGSAFRIFRDSDGQLLQEINLGLNAGSNSNIAVADAGVFLTTNDNYLLGYFSSSQALPTVTATYTPSTTPTPTATPTASPTQSPTVTVTATLLPSCNPPLLAGNVSLPKGSYSGTLSLAYIPAAGTNTLLLVKITQTGSNPDSVKFKGINLSQAYAYQAVSTIYTSIWYLVNPGTSSGTLQVADAGFHNHNMAIMTFSGVSQTSPIGSVAPGSAYVVAGGSYTSTLVSQQAGSLVTDLFYAANGGLNSLTKGSGQTQEHAVASGYPSDIYGTNKAATSVGNQMLTYGAVQWGNRTYYNLAVELKAACGVPTPIPTGTVTATQTPTPNPTAVLASANCASAITVDGSLNEAGWAGMEWTPLAQCWWGSCGNGSARFKTLWDSTYLYVAVDVTDSSIHNDSADWWEDDSVGIYLGQFPLGNGTYQADEFNFAIRQSNIGMWERNNKSTSGISTAVVASGVGYVMEWAIPWSTVGMTPASNLNIGFDVEVNFDQNGVSRDFQLGWQGQGTSYLNPSAWGMLQLQSCSGGGLSAALFSPKKRTLTPSFSLGRPLTVVPNPAPKLATAYLEIEEQASARLELYAIDGTKIRTWNLGQLSPGQHKQALDLGGVSQGIYLMCLIQDTGYGPKQKATFKMAVLP